MATYSNIFIDQGSDFAMTVDLTQSVGTLDLTGYTARGSIKKTYSSTTKVDFTINVDVTDTELDISLSNSQTGAMKAGRYVYDIEIVSSSSHVTRVLEGQLEITPRVTTG
tara:strand:+ start:171 stop:500 length:330 start_codon:yes stop_codon:yes gene_type:complete